MATLASSVGHKGGIRHLRDDRFFEWRYRNPFAEYRFVFWKGEATAGGYLVLGSPIGRSWTYIADWEATDLEVFHRLLQSVTVWSNPRHDLEIWSPTLTPEQMAALARIGFEESPPLSRYSGRLLLKSLTGGETAAEEPSLLDRLADLQNWDLREIYSDAT